MAADPYSVQVVDWTILPAKVTARAWVDPGYRGELLTSPDGVLRRDVRQWTSDISFTVHADTASARHLPLPALKERFASWTEDQLAAVLAIETGGSDDSFEYQLPPAVILKSLTDVEYRHRLLTDPDDVLRRDGHELPMHLRIHENTSGRYHLALPESPTGSDDLDFGALRDRLIGDFMTATTRCCATGTCT